jgi:hypothetical protein
LEGRCAIQEQVIKRERILSGNSGANHKQERKSRIRKESQGRFRDGGEAGGSEVVARCAVRCRAVYCAAARCVSNANLDTQYQYTDAPCFHAARRSQYRVAADTALYAPVSQR